MMVAMTKENRKGDTHVHSITCHGQAFLLNRNINYGMYSRFGKSLYVQTNNFSLKALV